MKPSPAAVSLPVYSGTCGFAVRQISPSRSVPSFNSMEIVFFPCSSSIPSGCVYR